MQPFNVQQLAAIEALSNGLSASAAADAIGVPRTTILHWCRIIPDFREALEVSKRVLIENFRSEMNALANPAINILRNIIHDDSAPPALRVRTALAIIKFVTTPEKSASSDQQPPDQMLNAAFRAGYLTAQKEAGLCDENYEIHHNSSPSSVTETDESQKSEAPPVISRFPEESR